ncbi:putative cysteine peptidase [Mycoplasma hafezii]|uniref:putative cysteine peptidase n=1 Tax=Mycoplasma hafezii TaxID=525886 RepID=UPI003CF68827
MKPRLWKKVFFASSLTLLASATPLVSLSTSNIIHNEEKSNNEYILNSELVRINRIDSTNKHKILFYKYITDLNNRKVILVAFDGLYSVIDFQSLITLETIWQDISEYENNDNLFYAPSYGLIEKLTNLKYKQLLNSNILNIDKIDDLIIKLNIPNNSLVSEIEKVRRIIPNNSGFITLGNKDDNKTTVYTPVEYAGIWRGAKETFYSNPNVSNLSEHAWWWLTRDSYNRVGYDEDRADKYHGAEKSKGWCAYIALANLLLYNELFKYDGLFSDEEYKRFIKDDYNPENKIRYTSPVFKWTKYNDHAKTEEERKTFAYYLHDLNHKHYNFYNGMTAEKLLYLYVDFAKGKKAQNKYLPHFSTEKYSSRKMAVNWIVNKKLPVILSISDVNTSEYYEYNHVAIAYGYDEETSQFLITNLWGSKKTNACLISRYLDNHNNTFFALEPQNYSDYYTNTKKYFKYKGQNYDWRQIEDYIIYDKTADC